MKRLVFALSGILLLTSTGWGEQLKPGEQAHASVAAHRQEAKDNARHRHQPAPSAAAIIAAIRQHSWSSRESLLRPSRLGARRGHSQLAQPVPGLHGFV